MTIRDVADLGTILSIWAHPDDESYLSGGIMAAAVAAGSRVVCVTATRGEAGGPGTPAETAIMRDAELLACLAALGVQEHHWLGYPDGGCADADPEGAIAQIAAILSDVAPDAVLTFGPDGYTDHPDHRAVSGWVTEALARKGHLTRLHYVTGSPEWFAEFRPAYAALGLPDSLPPVWPADQLSIEIVLEQHALDRKIAGLDAQPSQTAATRALWGDDLFRRALAVESYRSAAR
jgi:LmbE family N-acetylglucosaminyl deacetylase